MKALLLSNNNGQPVWQLNNEIVTGMQADRYIFPHLPENLIAQPTLVWRLENGGARAQTLEASYLTGGITWKADYVLNLSADEKTADLNGWVTIDNRSGAAYKNAGLQLVAGDLNRVRDMNDMLLWKCGPRRCALTMAKQEFGEESLFEYHLYTLDRKTTLKENQTKQISLLSGAGRGSSKGVRRERPELLLSQSSEPGNTPEGQGGNIH